MIPGGIGNKDIIYVGSASSTEFIKVNLSPMERYWDFHLANFFSHFSITPFQISIDIDMAPKAI